MTIAETMLPEFDHETATTRLLLERVPDRRKDFRPHEKSMTLGELAIHLSTLPRWAVPTFKETAFDLNPPEGPAFSTPAFTSVSDALKTYDEAVASARALLAATSDAELMVPWTLKNGGQKIFSMPRVGVFRTFIMNHTIHHRGQLSVYLRACDVALPNIYGPTADTK
jgi:uncharacterized damage-inducible protein DinB